MRSMLDFAASCNAMPDALQAGQMKGVRAASLYVVRGIRAEIMVATGGDNRLSGVGKNGKRVGARYDIKGRVNPTALIKATGPLHLIERDTSAHEIKAKRRRGGNAALKVGDKFYRSVEHPGTRAKRPFGKGVDKTAYRTPEIFNEAVWRETKRAFGQ